jgi:nicotinamide mononucleotide (NMN) deamidase PncC
MVFCRPRYDGRIGVINLEEAVVRKLKASQYILTTIESCTGGLICHLITNVSGASEIFYGSLVVYDNSTKLELGVSKNVLEKKGAVSAEVARELADLGLQKMQNNPYRALSPSLLKPRGFICVATTGIAGPTGGSKEKPVGLCYIGLAVGGKKTVVEKFQTKDVSLSRVSTKTQFAQKALELIRTHV